MKDFTIFATLYIPVSFKEQKQARVGVKPEAEGSADFLPISLFVSLHPSLSLSASASLCLSPFLPPSLIPPCPLLIILG